ncbi:hydrogenase 1 small subunit [Salmonella enterica]|nr:hydrogenase 1 small subunit [Salmonella enterica]
MNNEETFYQAMRRKGVTRRSFLKFCSLAATSLGLGAGMTPKIAWALENKPRIPVVWIHGLECTCCTESFIRSSHPLAKDVILSLISLDYDDTLMAAAGAQAEEVFDDITTRYAGKYILAVEGNPPLGEQGMFCISGGRPFIEKLKKAAAGAQAEEVFDDITTRYAGKYILAVEGNPPLGEQGMFCISGGRPFIEKLKKAAAGASAIIAWGNCASWGCVQAARPNPTQATPIDKVITDKPIVKVPGCPPIPDVMSAIITYMVTFDRLPELDRMGRPLMFYGQRIHDKCYRRAHFDAGEFVESWDDDAARKGYCLYKMGCKGPTTYNACSSTRWNDGVSFPIQSGHGCLGCSENGFWDRGSFYSRVVDIPQMGTHSTADTVGLTALGVVAAGVGGHAIASALNQRKRHKQQLAQAEQQPDNEDKQA